MIGMVTNKHDYKLFKIKSFQTAPDSQSSYLIGICHFSLSLSVTPVLVFRNLLIHTLNLPNLN